MCDNAGGGDCGPLACEDAAADLWPQKGFGEGVRERVVRALERPDVGFLLSEFCPGWKERVDMWSTPGGWVGRGFFFAFAASIGVVETLAVVTSAGRQRGGGYTITMVREFPLKAMLERAKRGEDINDPWPPVVTRRPVTEGSVGLFDTIPVGSSTLVVAHVGNNHWAYVQQLRDY